METVDLPKSLAAAQFQWSLQKAGLQFRSPFNGTLQGTDLVADRWTVNITWPPRYRENAGEIEAFGNWLAGGVNRMRLWHMGTGRRGDAGRPLGTLRGTPTLSGPIARGDKVLPVAGVPGATLWAGDMVKVNGQMLQVRTLTVLGGGGTASVPLVNRVRAACAAGAAIEWDRPTADFVLPAMRVGGVHVPRFLLGSQWDLEEVW